MDVIATTAFGIEVDSQKDPNNKFVHYGRLAAIGRLPASYILFTSKIDNLLFIIFSENNQTALRFTY